MPRLAPCLASLTLLLATACGSSGTTGGADEPEVDAGQESSSSDGAGTPLAPDEVDACGGLDVDDVEQLVGEPVVRDAGSSAVIPMCTFVSDEDAVGSVVQVLALPMGGLGGFADFDQVIDTQRTPEGELVIEELDVAGADRTVLVDDDAYGQASTTLLAEAEGVAYTVYPSGVTRADQARVATGAFAAVLGGDVPDASVIEPSTDDVCSLLPRAPLEGVLGAPVTPDASDVADPPSCRWTGEDVSLLVLDLGRSIRIEGPAGLGADDGSNEVTRIDSVDGVEAYVSVGEYGVSTYVAWSHRLYSFDVDLPEGSDVPGVLERTIALLRTA